MKRINIEIAVGLFMVIGFVCVAWISIRLGDLNLFEATRYPLSAHFTSVAGLKKGAPVQIAGVEIGTVDRISLDQEYYEAIVHMNISSDVRIQEDSIASIRSTGIIGDKFISISPGGSPEYLAPGGRIAETESALSIEEIISKYIFEGEGKK